MEFEEGGGEVLGDRCDWREREMRKEERQRVKSYHGADNTPKVSSFNGTNLCQRSVAI